MLSIMIGRSTITVFMDGETFTVDESHMNYPKLKAELGKPDAEVAKPDQEPRDLGVIRNLLSVRRMIATMNIGQVEVTSDAISYKGKVVNNYMTRQMLEFIQQDIPIEPWAEFMDNLMLNPSKTARNELYEWLEKGNMPITPDGYFLAFKRVNNDYTDCHSNTFDNSVGNYLEMPRDQCDTDRNRTCSTGFHFCSADYLKSFRGGRLMLVKVNPRDVTSIPSDYNQTKGRCCAYHVVAELSRDDKTYDPIWKRKVIDIHDPELESLISLTNLRAKSKKKKAKKAVTAKQKAKSKTTAKASPSLVFKTRDKTVTLLQIKHAMKQCPSVRAAARSLRVGESTLRGWNEKIVTNGL